STVTYFDPAFPDRTLLLHAARPRHCDAATPIVFVHHGVARNGKAYRDYWQPHVDEAGLLAISVEFPEASFPEYLWYNFGNLHTADGTPNPRERWTFGIVARLFDALRAQGLTVRQRYGLFGHSAGGQFVHRMLSFGYRDRVAVAVSANAGTYAMPDLAVPWPFGLGGRRDGGGAARAAGVPHHGDGGHRRYQDHRTVLPEGAAFPPAGSDPVRAGAQLRTERPRRSRRAGHVLQLDGDRCAGRGPRRGGHVGSGRATHCRGAACVGAGIILERDRRRRNRRRRESRDQTAT